MEGDFRIGKWLIQPELNRLATDNKEVRLEPKVMEVLVYLARHPGKVLRKERILQAVWPDTFVSDDVLIHAVSELRKAFEEDARSPHIIETIARRGYRLAIPVEPAEAPTLEARPPAEPVSPDSREIAFFAGGKPTYLGSRSRIPERAPVQKRKVY